MVITEEVFVGPELVSWPNPSGNYFNIKLITENNIDKVEILVFDVAGKLVYQGGFKPNAEYRFGDRLEGGLYVVKITQANNQHSVNLVKAK